MGISGNGKGTLSSISLTDLRGIGFLNNFVDCVGDVQREELLVLKI